LSVKSLYVPPQAIQGEEIPSHILWDALDYGSIKVKLPTAVKLKEIYNVDEGKFKVSNGEIVVEKVAVDGYLGFLFSTFKLSEHSKNVELEFAFIDNKGEEIFRESKTVHLFRPDLKIVDLPKIIKVDPENGQVQGKIKLQKVGQGTLIINFSTSVESETQRQVPDTINEFLSNINKDLQLNLNEIKKAFPQYSGPVDRYLYFLLNSWNTYSELGDLKRVIKELHKALNASEKFANAFFEALAKSFVKNIKFFTIPESLLKYLDSVLSKKVWLVQPWQIVPVSTETKTLVLEILPTDLLLDDSYELVKLPPVEIQATSNGSIEIARLFDWR
jgi:hypothetical protein